MAAPMANVRVKLVFPETSENCWFLINRANDQTIQDVEARVRRRFDSDNRSVRLFLDGCWLPTEESSFVLHDNDTVNVRFAELSSGQYSSPHKEGHNRSPWPKDSKSRADEKEKKKERKEKSKRDNLTNICQSEPIKSPKSREKKHKHKHKKDKRQLEEVDDEHDQSEPKKKKKKSEENHSSLQGIPIVPSRKDTDLEIPPKANQVDKKKEKDQKKKESESGSESSGGEEASGEKPKRRKRRRRKRKTSTKVAIEVSKLCPTPVVTKPNPVAHRYQNTSVYIPTPARAPARAPARTGPDGKHVHFESDSEPTDSALQVNSTDLNPTTNQDIPNGDKLSIPISTNSGLQTVEPTITTSMPSNLDINATNTLQHPENIEAPSNENQPMDVEKEGENDNQAENEDSLLNSMTSMAGYQIVPPPNDYRPKNQQGGGRKNRPAKGPAGHLQGAQVFNRRRSKKNAFHPLSKEEQLNSVATNRSIIYENPNLEPGSNGVNGETFNTPQEPPKDYSSMEQLHGLPREKERIAFKILEISEDCTPQMSDFQEAIVLKYDPLTKCVDLEMSNSVQRVPSRFDIVVEDEDEILTNVSNDLKKTVSWTSLVDVRLVPST